ncbi:MAG TPA: protein kinase [Candidatus Binatia bacterium]|nr:protein kinase [Candidatus Binatia bacterium]
MTVAAGTNLGPYSILSQLGKGGMGEVYRARDTRLDRIVAIKVLATEISGTRSSRLRLEREARALSSLSHPHVCSIFDVGSQDGMDYLVMEYLEGVTLANRLARGPLPLPEVLHYGAQIAAALEAAHQRGIIHRDLKPGNIMLTKSGIKVLDFGLATRAAFSEVTNGPNTPTIEEPLTKAGAFLGTLQYMSPEQLEGREADARSDIFGLGLVIYEMLTGKTAFSGGSQASVVASIMTAEPTPIKDLNLDVPAPLQRLIRVCMAKKAEDRWEAARDVKLQLQGMASEVAHEQKAGAARGGGKWKLAALAGAVATVIALAALLYFMSTRAAGTRVLAGTILQPEGHIFVFMGPFGPPAFSPDSRTIAFVAASLTEPPQIWVRSLDSPNATKLPGTENAYYPFWSPDGRYIGFFSGTKLKKIAIAEGAPITVCDADFARGGSWNQNDEIIFGKFPGGIYRVSASGGNPAAVTTLDESRHDVTHRWPSFLPDGKHFLYMASSYGPESEKNSIFLGSLDGAKPNLLLNASSNALYAAGHLFYVHESTIVARSFNPSSGELSGEAVSLVQNVAYDATTSDAAFAISRDGDLAYQTAANPADFQLMLFDGKGKPAQPLGDPGVALNPRFSPDGKRVLVSSIDRRTGQSDVWSYDLDRVTRTRLTFGGIRNNDAIWSHDGNAIAYSSYRNDRWAILTRAADGTGNDTTVYEGQPTSMNVVTSFETTHFVHNEPISPTSWTSDRKEIIFSERLSGGQWIIEAVPSDGHGAPTPLLKANDTNFRDGELSPDGKWIAYESDESGHDEIYISQFPSLKQKQQVSLKGGSVPRWQRNGRELCYIRSDKNVTCADLAVSGESLHVTAAHPLFPLAFLVPFDVSADGGRFLLSTITNMQNPAPLSVITHWTSRLK